MVNRAGFGPDNLHPDHRVYLRKDLGAYALYSNELQPFVFCPP